MYTYIYTHVCIYIYIYIYGLFAASGEEAPRAVRYKPCAIDPYLHLSLSLSLYIYI